MDLTEEKVSFDQMPAVVSELKDEIRGLKVLIGNLIARADSPSRPRMTASMVLLQLVHLRCLSSIST